MLRTAARALGEHSRDAMRTLSGEEIVRRAMAYVHRWECSARRMRTAVHRLMHVVLQRGDEELPWPAADLRGSKPITVVEAVVDTFMSTYAPMVDRVDVRNRIRRGLVYLGPLGSRIREASQVDICRQVAAVAHANEDGSRAVHAVNGVLAMCGHPPPALVLF